MSVNLEKQIIDDLKNYLSIDEIAFKYKDNGVSPYIVKQIIKKNNINRSKTCKMLKLLGTKPSDIFTPHQEELNANKPIYDKRTVKKSLAFKQKLNSEPLEVVQDKKNELDKDVILMAEKVLKRVDKTLKDKSIM